MYIQFSRHLFFALLCIARKKIMLLIFHKVYCAHECVSGLVYPFMQRWMTFLFLLSIRAIGARDLEQCALASQQSRLAKLRTARLGRHCLVSSAHRLSYYTAMQVKSTLSSPNFFFFVAVDLSQRKNVIVSWNRRFITCLLLMQRILTNLALLYGDILLLHIHRTSGRKWNKSEESQFSRY